MPNEIEEWDGDNNSIPLTYIDESKDTPKDFDGVPLIISDRTFGVELEMFGGKKGNLHEFCAINGHRLENDGSIRDNKGNHGGTEAITKVLTGVKGAKDLIGLTEMSKKEGYKCNYSTGTHIHLGASDFYTKDTFKQQKLNDINKKKGEDILLVESLLLSKMRKSLNMDTIINRYLVEGYLKVIGSGTYTSNYVMEDGKTSYITIVPCTYLGNRYYILCRLSTIQEQMGLKPQSLYNGRQVLKITDTTTNVSRDEYGSEYATLGVGKVVVFTKERNNLWSDLKTLFAFYTYFDEVFFAMLPPSRKNSMYCVPLTDNYLLSQVLKINDEIGLEKLWFGNPDIESIENMKNERKHISRRSAINLHSIFNIHRTLEVRSHHGTLNGHSILAWVALHQLVMDSIKSRKFDWTIFTQMKSKLSISEKTQNMCALLGVEGELLKFVKNRLQVHSNITL